MSAADNFRVVKVQEVRGLTRLPDGTVTWPEFIAGIEHPRNSGLERDLFLRLRVKVNRRGIGRCVSLEVDATDGGHVTGELLREIPVSELVRKATATAGSTVGDVKEVKPGVYQLSPLGGRGRKEVASRIEEAHPAPRGRGTPLEDEFLIKVAKVYKDALNPVSGRAKPNQAVQDEFGVKRPTVSKWIEKARERGYLPPATPGKAG